LSNQKTSKTCVSGAAFKQNAPKVDLAFDVIFLVLFLALAGIAGFRLLKSKQKGSAIGKWFLFPISLFFAILYVPHGLLNRCR
jgi:phosphoglycerol transferase MdoB-like AlkP superfamily enzyme